MFCPEKRCGRIRNRKVRNYLGRTAGGDFTGERAQKSKVPHFQKCAAPLPAHPGNEQLRLKKNILRETLARLGGIAWDGAIVEHSAEPYGYRNRAQLAVRSGCLGRWDTSCGEFGDCAIDECPVLSPRLAHTFAQLRNARSARLPEASRRSKLCGFADEKIALNVAFEKFPNLRRNWHLLSGNSCHRSKVCCCWTKRRTG